MTSNVESDARDRRQPDHRSEDKQNARRTHPGKGIRNIHLIALHASGPGFTRRFQQNHAGECEKDRCHMMALLIACISNSAEPEKDLHLITCFVNLIPETRRHASVFRHLTIHAIQNVADIDK